MVASQTCGFICPRTFDENAAQLKKECRQPGAKRRVGCIPGLNEAAGEGSEGGGYGFGTLFKMTPEGTITTLHSFSGADGAYPYASLIQAPDGSFYGTTISGGAYTDQLNDPDGDALTVVWAVNGQTIQTNLVPAHQATTGADISLSVELPLGANIIVWTPTSLTGAPVGRVGNAVVWTGTEMIVWGGIGFGTNFADGGRYSPATDSWKLIPKTQNVYPRSAPTAVWAANKLIIWGGFSVDTGLSQN